MSIDSRAAFQAAVVAARAGHAEDALSQLRLLARPEDAFVRQNQYARLALALSPQLPTLPILRVAFLAGSTIEPLIDLLGFWLLVAGFRLEACSAPFDSWRQQAMDPGSELYAFKPHFVWFFLTARDLRLNPVHAAGGVGSTVESALRDVASAASAAVAGCRVPVIVNNIEATSIRVLGNHEGEFADSAARRVREFNAALPPSLPAGCSVFDLEHQAASFGLQRWEDARLWFHSKHPFALDAFGPVAFAGSRLLAASRGRSRKCIVLDLDNTLWGGVVGDDGAEGIRFGANHGAVGEAFEAFQRYLKALSERGIALAVCSKNDDDLAREAFSVRAEMVLGLDDFAVFQANWGNKADNIRLIAKALNIGTDALVFVDDNPAERALVRAELPEVAVIEMPDDPSDFVAALAAGAWFETLALSDEDRQRAKAYRDNAARTQASLEATDLKSYLRELDMRASWGLADPAHLPRMAQLLSKTNQFQLTDVRHSEAQLAALSTEKGAWIGWFSLRDRFGDHGLISVVALRQDGTTAYIDAWAMSCRVFSRGMEDFIFGVLLRETARRGCTHLVGCYVASRKNGVVSRLYERLGGQPDDSTPTSCWRFDLLAPPPPSEALIAEIEMNHRNEP